MEQIYGSYYGAEDLYLVKDKISQWNFEKLFGLGYYRGHDKYCYLEVSIYEYGNYPDKEKLNGFTGSYIDFNVETTLFPIQLYELNKKELFDCASFIIGIFSALIGKSINLIFEINFAGFGPTDNWGKGACRRALIKAVISCFEENIYKQGMEHKANYYTEGRIKDLKAYTASLNNPL